MMALDKSVIVIGEGVPDPKACFGTTKDLKMAFPKQVFDMPVSENGMTGVCAGLALNGFKPVLIHMRQDFMMYSMDQIVNNIAKWYSMFGGQRSMPLVIKAFTGRGWGAGKQHSQNLEALFTHIPGLKVVTASCPKDAKGLMIAAIKDPNPVIILESRWIHPIMGEVDESLDVAPIGEAHVISKGRDITIVSWGFMVNECRRAVDILRERDIYPDLLDLRTLRPLPTQDILKSCFKTRDLLVVSDAWKTCGVSAEIVSYIAEQPDIKLKTPPTRLQCPDYSPASSPALIKGYYPTYIDIVKSVSRKLNIHIELTVEELEPSLKPHDVPDKSFTGPF